MTTFCWIWYHCHLLRATTNPGHRQHVIVHVVVVCETKRLCRHHCWHTAYLKLLMPLLQLLQACMLHTPPGKAVSSSPVLPLVLRRSCWGQRGALRVAAAAAAGRCRCRRCCCGGCCGRWLLLGAAGGGCWCGCGCCCCCCWRAGRGCCCWCAAAGGHRTALVCKRSQETTRKHGYTCS
jgi:hypothetical protein